VVVLFSIETVKQAAVCRGIKAPISLLKIEHIIRHNLNSTTNSPYDELFSQFKSKQLSNLIFLY